jgi:hypothetical protein
MLEKKYTEKTFTLEILYHVGVYENSIHFICIAIINCLHFIVIVLLLIYM